MILNEYEYKLVEDYQPTIKPMKKNWYESRTMWIAIAQAVAGILVSIFSENPELQFTGAGVIIKSALDLYLRLHTKKEIV